MAHNVLNRITRSILTVVIAVCVGSTFNAAAYAEADQVRIAQQIGLQNLPVAVMVKKKLIEKHAKAMGLGNVKVTLVRLGSGAATNDALLSGGVDFVAAGVAPLLKIWDKTNGNVRAIGAMVDLPMTLNTNRPNVRSLKDFSAKDRIAVPAIKVSINAIVLEMAAKQLYGDPSHFDTWTVSMRHPDAMAALLSGQSSITAHFTIPPFSEMEARDPHVHTVTTSYDILGGPHTQFVLYNTKQFRSKNPKLLQAVYAALSDAVDTINRNKRAAAELYIKLNHSHQSVDFVESILNEPQIVYTTTPKNVMKFATFMHSIGAIDNMPKNWKALFWGPVLSKPGS